ncbi:MAG: DUF1192 domain-containing protein [Rhodospirillales bacterium]|nr:DUF1192 domain-containing protein [Rhodospirillales bacterium]
MDMTDPEPGRRAPEKKNLDPLSIAELTDYIAGLEAEIRRARDTIARKRQDRTGAESLFRK